MRFPAFMVALLLLAGCGGVQNISAFGDVDLVVGASPGADDAGIYLATARGYDAAEGVTLRLERSGTADFRLVRGVPPERCITVLAIVRPDKLVLCVDEITLQDERPKVLAVVRALRRGYLQAQLEPDEAVAAMGELGLPREELSAQLDDAAPTWTAGARYFGEIAAGPGRDPTIARDAAEDN